MNNDYDSRSRATRVTRRERHESVAKRLRIKWVPLVLVVSLIGATPCAAGGRPPLPSTMAIRLAQRYFQDLNAHQYRAAYMLEATCGLDLVVGPGDESVIGFPGRGRSTIGLPARGTNVTSGTQALSFVQAAHVSAVHVFATPLFRRYHLIGVQVSGVYRFKYPANWVHNDQILSGFHRIRIIVHRCGTHWGINESWRYSFVQPGYGIGWR